MRTHTWQPPAPEVPAQGLGLTQRLVVHSPGQPARELSAMAALYLTLVSLRTRVEFSVTTHQGEELAHNRGGKLVADERFGEALYLFEQFIMQERQQAAVEAAHAALDEVAERVQRSEERAAREEQASGPEPEREPRAPRGQQPRNSEGSRAPREHTASHSGGRNAR